MRMGRALLDMITAEAMKEFCGTRSMGATAECESFRINFRLSCSCTTALWARSQLRTRYAR